MTVRVRYPRLHLDRGPGGADRASAAQARSIHCSSAPTKKFVTEQAYENPRFVEDMVREAHSRLSAQDNITWFSVEAENFESIHNHSAYAAVELDRR